MSFTRQYVTFIFAATSFLVTEGQKPVNVLLIAVDDMNNYIGCMGGPAITPNIDALAKRGVLFSNAYCAAPACNPSRTAIMTGLRPERTGQYTNQGNFRDIGNNKSLLTLPQKLQAAGYQTIEAGKIFHYPHGNSVVPNPLSDPVSWTKQIAGQTGTSVPLTYKTRSGVAVWLGDDTLDYTNGKKVDYLAGASIWGPNTQTVEQTGDWKMSQACVEFLRQQHEKPFFFAVGFSKPHQPLVAPKEYFELYPLDKIGFPDYLITDMEDVPAVNKQNFSSPFVEKVRKHRQTQLAYQAYLACMSFTDACIGNVLNALNKSRYANNTVVIFFSDHGFQLGTKNRWEKYSLWKLATNSPLIVYLPENKFSGTACNEAVSLMDIHATVLEATGINLAENLDCVSLLPQVLDPKKQRKLPAVITHEEGNHSIVWRQYNYIRYNNGSEELYDHFKDNLEYRNEAENGYYKGVMNELKKFIPKVLIPQNSNQKKTIGTLE